MWGGGSGELYRPCPPEPSLPTNTMRIGMLNKSCRKAAKGSQRKENSFQQGVWGKGNRGHNLGDVLKGRVKV